MGKPLWFTKSKRAQSSDDDETWITGGVAPTLNAFDNGDTRATVVIVMREREGRAGGGKGPLMSDKSFTLATSNFQTVFLFEATRVDDTRIYTDYSPTVARYWGTGGARVPYVYGIQGNMIGRSDENGPQGSGVSEDVMFTLTKTDTHAVAMTDKAKVECLTPWAEMGEAMRVYKDEGIAPIVKQHNINILSTTVRRLTPTECERLQGFPDGWTEGQADSHRYKQMGNAVAVPVVDWIIGRIVDGRANTPSS